MTRARARSSYATVDVSRRRGVQTYQDVHGRDDGPMNGLRLRDVLEQLGDEIREAQAAALRDGKPDVIRLRDCSIELGLTWDAKGAAGVEFWVFKLGGELSRSNTQTITLNLDLLDPGRSAVPTDELLESVELRAEREDSQPTA